MNRPSVFDYNDYGEFLKDMFSYKKKTAPSYSYRFFSRLAGFSSPYFLKLVMDGQRNLTSTSIARGFKLKKPERDFFENLVYMNQAADHTEQDHYYRKVLASKSHGRIKNIETAQYEYFSRWYLPVIREVATFGNGRLTPEQIARRMNPALKVKDVEIALKRLEDLGLICRDEGGCWKQTDALLSTGPEVKSLLIFNFHKEMETSMERFSREGKGCHGGHQHGQAPHGGAQTENRRFRKAILQEFANENANQVVQVNIQAFPLTRTDDEVESA